MNNVIVFLNGVRGISVVETIHKSKHEIIAVVTPSNTSDEISKIKGQHSNKISNLLGYISKSEVIHKDDMVEV